MRFTISHLTDTDAVLRTDDAQELRVPISELPDGAEEGGMLDLPLTIPHADASDRTQRAKDILNEILGSGNTAS